MIRSSPTRRVTRSRSRYSSSGMAYFRVMPNRSLNCGTLSLGVFALLAMTWRRSAVERVAMKNQVVGQLYQDAIAQQQGDDLLRAGFVHRQGRQHVLQQRYRQAGFGEGLLDLGLRFGLFVAQDDAASGKPQQFAIGFQLLLAQQRRDDPVEQLRRQVHGIRNSFFVDSLLAKDLPRGKIEPLPGDPVELAPASEW